MPADNLRTPIKVRRKRGKAQKVQRESAALVRQRRRKLEELKDYLYQKRNEEGGHAFAISDIIERTRKATRRTRTGLEALPPELIEHIFLDCLECNLPLASPYIASFLSRESIFRLLIRVAFLNPPRQLHDIFFARYRPPVRLDPEQFGDSERASLQHQILQCKWFNIDRLQAAGKDVFCLYADECWFKRCAAMDADQRSDLERRVRDGIEVESQGTQSDTQSFRDEAEKQLLLKSDGARGLILSQYASDQDADFPEWPMAVIFPCRCLVMPDNRLRGQPWTPEKVRFLCEMAPLLRDEVIGLPQLEGQSHPPARMSTSAVHEGIESAISESNVEALTVLLKYYLTDEDISPRYFLMATHQPQSVGLMKALVHHRPMSLPFDDSDLTQYAMSLKESGNSLGDEILDLMLNLPRPANTLAAHDAPRLEVDDNG